MHSNDAATESDPKISEPDYIGRDLTVKLKTTTARRALNSACETHVPWDIELCRSISSEFRCEDDNDVPVFDSVEQPPTSANCFSPNSTFFDLSWICRTTCYATSPQQIKSLQLIHKNSNQRTTNAQNLDMLRYYTACRTTCCQRDRNK